jgi:hypothetical protein
MEIQVSGGQQSSTNMAAKGGRGGSNTNSPRGGRNA